MTFGIAALVVALAGCSGAATPAPTTAPRVTSAPAGTTAPGVSVPAGSAGTASTATLCRHLKNLKDLDYAFGVSFTNIRALADSSKAQTLKDLKDFAAEAPPALTATVAGLVAFWTALAANPSSVTESDPRLADANKVLGDWLKANCA